MGVGQSIRSPPVTSCDTSMREHEVPQDNCLWPTREINEGKQVEETKVSRSPMHNTVPTLQSLLLSSQNLQTIYKNKNGLPEEVDENTPITLTQWALERLWSKHFPSSFPTTLALTSRGSHSCFCVKGDGFSWETVNKIPIFSSFSQLVTAAVRS